ncbi:three-helix bundle dimerization domain-containing protein [Microbacterium awajiense]
MGEKGIDEAGAEQEIIDRLGLAFPDVEPAMVETIVQEAYAGMANARVRDFVPVLVEREAKTRIKASRVAEATSPIA